MVLDPLRSIDGVVSGGKTQWNTVSSDVGRDDAFANEKTMVHHRPASTNIGLSIIRFIHSPLVSLMSRSQATVFHKTSGSHTSF